MEKLTRTEKIELEQSGYSKADIQEINNAINKTSYALVDNDGNQQKISADEALTLLGRAEWLRGIARSAFYITTTRFGLNGEKVAMHSRVYT